MKIPGMARLKRARSMAEDQGGFTIMEIVVAIPVTLLILGIVFASIGVTSALMAQVGASAGAARAVNTMMDDLSDARNCADLGDLVARASVKDPAENFDLSFPGYSCNDGQPVALTVEASKSGESQIAYTKTVTLAVM